jgi:hypothetical protein
VVLEGRALEQAQHLYSTATAVMAHRGSSPGVAGRAALPAASLQTGAPTVEGSFIQRLGSPERGINGVQEPAEEQGHTQVGSRLSRCGSGSCGARGLWGLVPVSPIACIRSSMRRTSRQAASAARDTRPLPLPFSTSSPDREAAESKPDATGRGKLRRSLPLVRAATRSEKQSPNLRDADHDRNPARTHTAGAKRSVGRAPQAARRFVAQ